MVFDQYKWLSDHLLSCYDHWLLNLFLAHTLHILSHLYSHFQLLNDGGWFSKPANNVFNICFNISATKPRAEAKKANDTAVLLLQCFVFCIVMYYLFIGYFCWISGLISHRIHLTCEYMTSLLFSYRSPRISGVGAVGMGYGHWLCRRRWVILMLLQFLLVANRGR